MFDALNASASGLEAAGKLINVAADNLANVNTPDYQPLSAQLEDVPGGGGGVDVVSITSEQVAPSTPGKSAVDPVKETENLRKARFLYAANTAAIKTQNQMFGNLINMLDTEQPQAPDDDRDSVL